LSKYTFGGAILLNILVFGFALWDGWFFEEKEEFVNLFGVVYFYAILITYVIYSIMMGAIENAMSANKKEVKDMKEYYSNLFVRYIFLIGKKIFVKVFVGGFLYIFGMVISLLTFGFSTLLLGGDKRFFIIAIIYAIYVTYALMYIGIYYRNKVNQENWQASCVHYFKNLIFFVILAITSYITFTNFTNSGIIFDNFVDKL